MSWSSRPVFLTGISPVFLDAATISRHQQHMSTNRELYRCDFVSNGYGYVGRTPWVCIGRGRKRWNCAAPVSLLGDGEMVGGIVVGSVRKRNRVIMHDFDFQECIRLALNRFVVRRIDLESTLFLRFFSIVFFPSVITAVVADPLVPLPHIYMHISLYIYTWRYCLLYVVFWA